MDTEILFALALTGAVASLAGALKSFFDLRKEAVDKEEVRQWLASGPYAERIQKMLEDGELDRSELSELERFIESHVSNERSSSVERALAELSSAERRRYVRSLVSQRKVA